MYKRESKKQLHFKDFYLPFGGHLDGKNRWVTLAELVPWDEFEEEYAQGFSQEGMGAPAKPFRMALGAELIKCKLNITDEEVVQQIRENHYMQYFIGMEGYRDEAPFDASMMTHFRGRLGQELINRVNERVIEREHKKKELKRTEQNGSEEEAVKNKGKLLLDTTCAPQDIRHPTDISLLNEVREKTEKVIDKLHAAYGKPGKKPRTYRRKARSDYLSMAKKRRKGKKVLRKSIRKQLGYIRRNFKSIEKQVASAGETSLSARDMRTLEVCREVFRQQDSMYERRSHKVENRIVSIGQPHVRPIVRGKTAADIEFGSKLLLSVVGGYARIENLSWENFDDGRLLKPSIESYKMRYGYYPESVHVDAAFRTRDNRKYCTGLGIRMSGPLSGRPSKKQVTKSLAERRQEAADTRDRIPIEGKFGNCKRKYGLDRIFAKRMDTSECEIAVCILLLNLEKLNREQTRVGYIFVIFLVVAFSKQKQTNGAYYSVYGQKRAA
jgi:hypothetical protein